MAEKSKKSKKDATDNKGLYEMCKHGRFRRAAKKSADLISTANIPKKLRKKLFSFYLEHEDSDTNIWKKIEEGPEFKEDNALEELKFTFRIDTITGGYIPLINHLQKLKKEGTLKSERDLVKRFKSDWIKDIDIVGIPPDITGENENERKENYAQMLLDSVKEIFPTAVIDHRIEKDDKFSKLSDSKKT